jgi:hypothetical protein
MKVSLLKKNSNVEFVDYVDFGKICYPHIFREIVDKIEPLFLHFGQGLFAIIQRHFGKLSRDYPQPFRVFARKIKSRISKYRVKPFAKFDILPSTCFWVCIALRGLFW